MPPFRLLIPLLLAAPVHAADFRIQVLNGRTGKPVAHEHVNVLNGSGLTDLHDHTDIESLTTDADGVIYMSAIAPDIHSFRVSVDWHRQCSPLPLATFPLARVVERGEVSQNSCKRSITAQPTPGTLTLFVRDETFFEKMAH